MRGECGARMQRVPDLTEDRVSLGEIFDDQRLHDPGGTLALPLGQPRPGLQQPGPAVFAHRRVQGRDGVQAVTWPSGGEQPLELLHGQPAAVRSELPRPRVQVARAIIIGQQRQPSQRPRVLARGQARVVVLGGTAWLAPHVGVHGAGQVHPLGVRRLLEDGAPAVGDRGHRQPVGRFRESLGVIVEQVVCREAVVVDRWKRQGPGRYGPRKAPEPEFDVTPAGPGAHLLGDRGVGHLGEPALVDGLEVVGVRRLMHGCLRGRARLGISARHRSRAQVDATERLGPRHARPTSQPVMLELRRAPSRLDLGVPRARTAEPLLPPRAGRTAPPQEQLPAP